MIDEANKHTSDRSGMVVSRDGGQSTDARVMPTPSMNHHRGGVCADNIPRHPAVADHGEGT